MAGTLTAASYTYDLIGWLERHHPSGKALPIAQLQAQINQPLIDAVWTAGNLPNGHVYAQNLALPTVSSSAFNLGAPVSRGADVQFQASLGLFSVWSEIDQLLLNLYADRGTFLMENQKQFWEAMTQKVANAFIYGDPTVDPNSFAGLATQYPTVNTANASSAANVIDAGGTNSGSLTSMYLVTWSPRSMFLFHDPGTPAGIRHDVFQDNVAITATGIGQGNRIAVFRERYLQQVGLAIPDWRWNVRACNIDVNALSTAGGAVDLTELIIKMMSKTPSIFTPPSESLNPMIDTSIPGKQCLYVPRTVMTYLRTQMLNKVGGTLRMDDWFGKKVLMFDNLAIRVCDQIQVNESQVV